MKKQLLCIVAVLIFFLQAAPGAFAKNNSANYPVRYAIKKYRAGNYTGCLQDCQYIVSRNSSNAVAYYYMAMSYARAGKKDEAVRAYSRVLALRPNATLLEYAATGKRCLETPDKCHPDDGSAGSPGLDQFLLTPDELSKTVKKDYQIKQLNTIKDEINNGKDIDSYGLRKLNDNSPEVKTDKIAQQKPTNDEIVAAMKVLQNAGINPYQATTVANPYSQMMSSQNPEQAQLNMLMGGNNQSQNGNNTLINMLPYMAAQSKDGTGKYSPQMMQSMIMNSMMSDTNFNMDDNKDK